MSDAQTLSDGLPPPTVISPEDDAWFRRHVAALEWAFAKTMPAVPHFYTTRRSWPSEREYERAAGLILAHGVPEVLWKFPVRRYLYADGWRYWVMTTDPSTSIVMNRCDPLHRRYAGQIRRAY